ncbi:UDP-N-acetylglucosamine 2-epimerase (non-hydrolyzing) [Candidatus Methanophagaceae archaeon]|jgi:UDP-N-acetylglucosamine 2-epimerase (non-hydrolysing)|nr:UDP-N-acetylglucosamine 2-epimerase (non-hydrolyzing) [Methanophagales archaeon]
MKIMSVVGARPNFIKMAPVIKEIEKRNLEHILVHTGQHYDEELSKIFMDELKLPHFEYLGVGSGTHGYQTGTMLIELEKVMLRANPDVVLVPGDTNTTLAGALAAVKLHIPVAHIEAGLRSFDNRMPEEINRILTDHCSDFLFCPTETAVENLKNEGIADETIFLVGDTMVDACFQNLEIAKKGSNVFKEHNIEQDYFFATVHRAENTDEKTRLEHIVDAFVSMDTQIVFPAHPRTVKQLKAFGLFEKLENAKNVLMIDPVGYLDSLMLISKAELMLTDSGGIQKEAFFLKVPCVTLRDNTEWVETIELGGNILVGAYKDRILEGVTLMLDKQLKDVNNPFGDGKASERIGDILSRLN